jgi:S1-C subfamily serine protease
MKRDPQNWRELGTLALVAIAVLIAGVALRPKSLAQKPKEPEVSISQAEVERLQSLASQTALTALSEQYAVSARAAANSIIALPTGSAVVWDDHTIVAVDSAVIAQQAMANGASVALSPAFRAPTYSFMAFRSNAALIPLGVASTPLTGDAVVAVLRDAKGTLSYAPGNFVRFAEASCGGDTWQTIETTLQLSESLSGAALIDLNANLLGVVLPCGRSFAILRHSALAQQLNEAETPNGKLRSQFGLAVAVLPGFPLKRSAEAPLVVTDIWDGSIGAVAGLRPGDVVLAVDSTPVASDAELLTSLNAPNAPAAVKVERDGRTFLISCSRSQERSMQAAGVVAREQQGIIVESVLQGSHLYNAGLRAGHLIISIDHKPATDQALRQLAEGAPHFVVAQIGARRKGVLLAP